MVTILNLSFLPVATEHLLNDSQHRSFLIMSHDLSIAAHLLSLSQSFHPASTETDHTQ